jgi:hypothetical protein
MMQTRKMSLLHELLKMNKSPNSGLFADTSNKKIQRIISGQTFRITTNKTACVEDVPLFAISLIPLELLPKLYEQL